MRVRPPCGSAYLKLKCGTAAKNLFLHYGDLGDSTNLVGIVAQVQPTEIYNLAAQSRKFRWKQLVMEWVAEPNL